MNIESFEKKYDSIIREIKSNAKKTIQSSGYMESDSRFMNAFNSFLNEHEKRNRVYSEYFNVCEVFFNRIKDSYTIELFKEASEHSINNGGLFCSYENDNTILGANIKSSSLYNIPNYIGLRINSNTIHAHSYVFDEKYIEPIKCLFLPNEANCYLMSQLINSYFKENLSEIQNSVSKIHSIVQVFTSKSAYSFFNKTENTSLFDLRFSLLENAQSNNLIRIQEIKEFLLLTHDIQLNDFMKCSKFKIQKKNTI